MSNVDNSVLAERALLGCLLETPEAWPLAAGLRADQFSITDHRKIFAAIARLHERNSEADVVSVAAEAATVADAYIGGLVDGVVKQNIPAYVRRVRQAAQDREFKRLCEHLAEAGNENRLAVLQRMQDLLQDTAAAENWRTLFHSYQEFETAPPLRFAIENFLQEAGVTIIGGLSGHGKTLIMLAMTRALLDGTTLFGHFQVPHPAERVLYLVPESSIGPIWSRIQLFRLQDSVRGERLMVRTLSCREQVSLDDVRLLKAAEGADVFLDTAVRFMDGSENDVENTRPFADILFKLLAAGARTICGAHHSPKGFAGADFMTLENILRGSGDLGAMLCTAWGIRQIDADQNQIFVQNVKPRDFQPCQPFILEGRPHLDVIGEFKMLQAPGTAGELRDHLRNKGAGRPSASDKDEKMRQAAELRAKGTSIRDIAEATGVGKSTVERWLFEYDTSKKRVQ